MQVECFTLIEVYVRDTGDILELEVIVEVVAFKVHVDGASWREVLRFCTRPARFAFSSPSSGAERWRVGSVFFVGL